MQIHDLSIGQLEAHPHNANVMKEATLKKLARHIDQTDQYPPIIVRPIGVEDNDRNDARSDCSGDAPSPTRRYQILDGHHRVKALQRLGRSTARCVVWAVDDRQALTLLATLNRLEGRDDPARRAALVEALSQHHDLASLSATLPEATAQLKRMRQARHDPPAPMPADNNPMPEAVHFFLYPQQRRRLEAKLREIGGSREQALLHAIGLSPTDTTDAEHGEEQH
jgi:hypothetical protein